VDLPPQPPLRPCVLREYALLADGERGALVGPHGHIVWLCAPHWHSEPVFAGLVGGSGVYQVAPAEQWSVWSGSYEPGTLIWHSRWVTTDTVVRCREALALPGDGHTAVLLRQVVAGDKPERVTVTLAPAAGFAKGEVRDLHRVDAAWSCRVGARYLRWSGAPDAVADHRGGLHLERSLPAGARHDFVLEISSRPFSAAPLAAQTAWQATEARWMAEVPDFADTIAPRDARHSYAVLRGLTSAGGAMVAAATTSLPEREQVGGNYDYRYAWIRDQAWVGQAVAAHGPHPLLHDAVRFVTQRLLADGPTLRPAYTVTGELVPEQRRLPLPGYPGGADFAGNQVTHQFQLDVFGEALSLFAAAARHDALEPDTWRAVRTAVDAIGRRWTEPDAGLWELDDRRWTQSRLACVAGLRAIAGSAPAGLAGTWRGLADALLASVNRDSLHPTGRWRRAPDDERPDAGLLLGALRGAVPASDPRSVATFRAVCAELGREGYVYRFRHANRELGATEGAFLVCGFLAALAAHQQGDPVAAVRWFERSRGTLGPAGLFAEEFDVMRRQFRGNLPQAFVHGLLIEAATRLAGRWS
jgi:alpha,alpha-trehalase